MLNSQTIEYKGTTKFKYTLTAENDVRIKIPDRFIGTQFEQDWINTCNEMSEVLLKEPRTATLRTRPHKKMSKVEPKLQLYTGGCNGHCIGSYDVFNKKFILKEKEVE